MKSSIDMNDLSIRFVFIAGYAKYFIQCSGDLNAVDFIQLLRNKIWPSSALNTLMQLAT